MNPPMEDIELNPEKLEVEKESGPLFHCDLCDTDVVHKIAQSFLPGLASACVDNTTGGLLKSPAAVAVEIRKEMVSYLTERSESFVAEAVLLEVDPGAQVSDNPYDIISEFVDDFVSTKRNFLSRVSGWLLSDRREDKIDDFVQEIEMNGFWLLNRRATVAQTLLKNVDFKNIFHCSSKFKYVEDLEEHKLSCSFRTLTCVNEGCNSTLSAGQMDHHDSVCPFKILQCEQKCSDNIMRREMDRHCITICPMKLVKCPFYSLGCQQLIPQCTIGKHQSENLNSHLSYILQGFHKEASGDDLKERVEQLHDIASPGQLASARDARSLTNLVKRLDAKFGPIISKKTIVEPPEEVTDLVDENNSAGMPVKLFVPEDSPIKKEENSHSPVKPEVEKESSPKEKITIHPSEDHLIVSPVEQKELTVESTTKTEVSPNSPPVKPEVEKESSPKETVTIHPSEDHLMVSPVEQKEPTEQKLVELTSKTEVSPNSPLVKPEVEKESSPKETVTIHPSEDHLMVSPVEQKEPTEQKLVELTSKTEVSPNSPLVKPEVEKESSPKEKITIHPSDDHLIVSPVEQKELTEQKLVESTTKTEVSPNSPPVKPEVEKESSPKEKITIHPSDDHSIVSPVEQKELTEQKPVELTTKTEVSPNSPPKIAHVQFG